MFNDILKLAKDEKSMEFRICAEFEKNSFSLIILQNSNAWFAEVPEDKISTLAKQLEIDYAEYYSKLKEILSKVPESVDFQIAEDFTIFYNHESNIRVKYFFCKMKKMVYSKCVENLLDRCYTQRDQLVKNLGTTSKLSDEYRESKERIESTLQEFIERKIADDQQVYSNFVLVLNEKKRKIQQLYQLLEAFKRGRPTLNPHVEVKKRKATKFEIKKEISDSDSDNSSVSYNTDDEKKSNEGENIDTSMLPSTSKQNHNLFLDKYPHDNPPKRMRVIETTKSDILNIPGTSKVEIEDFKIDTASEEKSPNITFDTQDLLDDI